MTNVFDSDVLITQTNDQLFIDLECGYGQPCVTTIYLKKNNGSTETLMTFNGNKIRFEFGKIKDFKYQSLDIHTTIDDIRDNPLEQEDISLKIIISESNSNSVSTDFARKTKGKGFKFHSYYSVTII